MRCSGVGCGHLLLAPSRLPCHGKVAPGAGSRPERLPRMLEPQGQPSMGASTRLELVPRSSGRGVSSRTDPVACLCTHLV